MLLPAFSQVQRSVKPPRPDSLTSFLTWEKYTGFNDAHLQIYGIAALFHREYEYFPENMNISDSKDSPRQKSRI